MPLQLLLHWSYIIVKRTWVLPVEVPKIWMKDYELSVLLRACLRDSDGVLGWVRRKATNSSKFRGQNISEQAHRFNTPSRTHFLFALSVQTLNSLTAKPIGRLLLMFPFGCFAKTCKYTTWGNKGVRKKRQRSQFLILVLRITNPVTRYCVQQGRMFLKPISVARWQPSLCGRACLRVSQTSTVFGLQWYLNNHLFGSARRSF